MSERRFSNGWWWFGLGSVWLNGEKINLLRLITLSVWVLWFPRNCRGLLRIKKIKNLMSSSASSSSLSSTATATTFHNPYVQPWCCYWYCCRCADYWLLTAVVAVADLKWTTYLALFKFIETDPLWRHSVPRRSRERPSKVGVIAGDLSCPNVNGVSRKVQKPLAEWTGPHTSYSSTWNGWPKLICSDAVSFAL